LKLLDTDPVTHRSRAAAVELFVRHDADIVKMMQHFDVKVTGTS
jgi:hypothetical protein